MVKEEIIEFLKNVPPFNMVNREDIEMLVESISMEYYPRGYMILRQNGPPSDSLNIIKKGAVRLFVINDEKQEIVIDYRGEGESFGFISMFSGDRSRANIQAIEDTICYLIPRDSLFELIQRNPVVNRYFVKSFFINFIDRTYEETRKRFSLIGKGDRLLYTTTISELIRREPVCVYPHTSIKETAQIMSKNKIGSVVVITDNRIPVGIVTDKDLREKVIARGIDPSEEIQSIMSSPVISIDSSDLCFEALLKMIRYNIHHLTVVEAGELKGVISNHDLMLLQGNSPTVLIKDIQEQQEIEALKKVNTRLIKISSQLLSDGARAFNITALITEIYEKLINKSIELLQKKIGPPTCEYAVFIFDSGGRMELSFTSDIKLGIVLDDTFDIYLIERAENYFTELINQLKSSFFNSGILYKNGNTGLLNREYIKTKKEWLDYFKEITTDPFRTTPEPGLLEMRCIRGDSSLIEAIRHSLFEQAYNSEDFADYLATVTVENRPPLGFLKRFVVEKTGEHKDMLNLYQKGIRPIIDSARIFSIKHRIKVRPTFKRLKELGERYGFGYADDLNHAINYLYTLLLHEQIISMEQGDIPSEFINPELLGSFEKKTLKESFQLIVNVYDVIEKQYKTERV